MLPSAILSQVSYDSMHPFKAEGTSVVVPTTITNAKHFKGASAHTRVYSIYLYTSVYIDIYISIPLSIYECIYVHILKKKKFPIN